MRTIQVLISTLLAVALISCGGSKQKSSVTTDSTKSSVSQPTANAEPVSGSVKKYPIKSGIVTFDMDMMSIKQKTILYFDDYGVKEAEEKYDGDAVKEMDLCDGKTRYTIMYAKKTAYSSGDCYRGTAYKFDWNEISKADKQYKVKKLANVNIAGKDCESYSMNSGDYPTVFAGWQNVLLYQETKTKYGTIIKKAVKVEGDASIPAEKFKIPEGFTVKASGM